MRNRGNSSIQLNPSTNDTLGTEGSGRCREVQRGANVWTVRQKQWPQEKSGRCREVAVSRGSTVLAIGAPVSIRNPCSSTYYSHHELKQLTFWALNLTVNT